MIDIASLSVQDVEAERYNLAHRDELISGKLRVIRPSGLSLYDTNIEVDGVYVKGEAPKTPLVYVFLASLVLPLVAYVRR
ncbi:hypothetical protein [Thermococcus gorgonarius]|uniref:hypothetical protein n=1 Tax=Thermococcus gorgonarius TaxID=71997 RepID=UPI001E4668AC|nr:hypothetical protein [Thermococcus gorgonarius]